MTATAQLIDGFAARLTAGTVLECVENTYNPARAGYRVTIDRPARRVFNATGHDGHGFRLELPTRARDLVRLDGDRIRYRIGRDDHEAEWRIVGAGWVVEGTAHDCRGVTIGHRIPEHRRPDAVTPSDIAADLAHQYRTDPNVGAYQVNIRRDGRVTSTITGGSCEAHR